MFNSKVVGQRKPVLAAIVALLAFSPVVMPNAATAQQSEPIQPLVVGNDRGGSLRDRIYEIRALRETGRPVRITGNICYSTCTMYLGLPQTCVTPKTIFGFHGPSSYGRALEPRFFERASELITDHYPASLQDWYMTTARHTIIGVHRINGTEIIRLGVRQC